MADVNLKRGEGSVEGEGIDPSELTKAVAAVGYKAEVINE
jgi:hypothetical protein